jgi:hypothetical protein
MTRTLSVVVKAHVTDLDDLRMALDLLFADLPAGFSVGPWQVSDTEARP